MIYALNDTMDALVRAVASTVAYPVDFSQDFPARIA